MLADVATAADEAGFDRISVMDHLWQIPVIGPPEHEMLEAYTTLGFLAAHTRRAKLLTLVTGVVYRDPGLLAKAVTTLDVLSGGRAMLGIGAAWNEEESRGLGLLFPPTAERFERLEEALQICLQMFAGDETAVRGQALPARPAAQLAGAAEPPAPADPDRRRRREEDAAARGQVRRRLQPVPRAGRAAQARRAQQHCETVGRDYDDIEKTVLFNFDLGEKGERVAEIIDDLRRLAGLGFTVAHGGLRNACDPSSSRSSPRRSPRGRGAVSGIEAVVFDLDGVIIDTEEVWEEVRRAYVAEHGREFLPGQPAADDGDEHRGVVPPPGRGRRRRPARRAGRRRGAGPDGRAVPRGAAADPRLGRGGPAARRGATRSPWPARPPGSSSTRCSRRPG